LAAYGLYVDRLGAWDLHDLELILAAISDLMEKAGWDIQDFRNAMGINGGPNAAYPNGIKLVRETEAIYKGKVEDWDGLFTGQTQYNGDIMHMVKSGSLTFYDQTFKDDLRAKVAIVHELAHAWDFAADNYLSNTMSSRTGAKMEGETYQWGSESPASLYGRSDQYEDWAEAVAATVYPQWGEFKDEAGNARMRSDSTRARYVRDQMTLFSSCGITRRC
jgi:hypothetical protein